ncbi:hypothetical protein [Sphingomonas mollis]|uniref:Uncharacterized protein n=1 Tax=Sphingomonas mollis TaxID=2795726 RepID=A0ABS0XJZ4_9SPHN|nr:hypothetical protein [Sphingomonas sp. BT553]MBJ6120351.1 hypothetical protein [Sphingomonas sp. BT553]
MFWDFPKDALGAFLFGDILFKSSIIFASGVGCLLSYIFISTTALSLLSDNMKSSKSKGNEQLIWRDLSNLSRLRIIFFSLLTYTPLIYLLYEVRPAIMINPKGFAMFLIVIFYVSMPLQPFVDRDRLKLAGICFGMTWAVIGPLAIGYGDATTDALSPKIKLEGNVCRVAFVGSSSILANCKNYYAITSRDKAGLLRWEKIYGE